MPERRNESIISKRSIHLAAHGADLRSIPLVTGRSVSAERRVCRPLEWGVAVGSDQGQLKIN
jgi:hypothetical protein